MKVVKTRGELAEVLAGIPKNDIGFVPTMGALHEGHLSLVGAARIVADGESGGAGDGKEGSRNKGVVVVSIFVNPTQFNDPSDLAGYPRTPERDLELLATAGVDVVFMPSVEEIYPRQGGPAPASQNPTPSPQSENSNGFDFGRLDKVMEGATRPGHFNGVAQVVSRLFELVGPARAFFGQKDFQQVAIVREMVRQAAAKGLGWADVEITECPTVREEDGLALSSRNVLLTPEHRAAAPDIYRALRLGAMKAGELSPGQLERFVTSEAERSGLLKVIYFNAVDAETLEPANGKSRSATVACIAVQAGGVRLIDNMKYE